MDIKIKNRDGVKLITGGKYCEEDINILFEENLFTTSIEDAIVTGTITTYSNHRINKISRCFMGASSLTYVDLPYITQIPINGFQGCSKLKTINIPSATTLIDQAFFQCTSLETIDLPSVTSIKSNVFTGENCIILLWFRPPFLCKIAK